MDNQDSVGDKGQTGVNQHYSGTHIISEINGRTHKNWARESCKKWSKNLAFARYRKQSSVYTREALSCWPTILRQLRQRWVPNTPGQYRRCGRPGHAVRSQWAGLISRPQEFHIAHQVVGAQRPHFQATDPPRRQGSRLWPSNTDPAGGRNTPRRRQWELISLEWRGKFSGVVRVHAESGRDPHAFYGVIPVGQECDNPFDKGGAWAWLQSGRVEGHRIH